MEFTAEQARQIAANIASTIDEVISRANGTGMLEFHGPDGSAVLAVVITANPLMMPDLIKWARKYEDLGTLVRLESHPAKPPADPEKYRTCPDCGALYDAGSTTKCLTCKTRLRPATQDEANAFEWLS